MNKKLSALAGITAVLFLVGTGCSIGKKDRTDTPTEILNQEQQESATPNEETDPIVATPVELEPTEPVSQPKPEVTKCTTIDCLIELAQTCSKGEVTYAYSIPFPFLPDIGITINGRTYYKINGKDGSGLCTFIEQTRGATVIMSAEGREGALQRGQTEEEIDAQLATMNASYEDPAILNSVMTCSGAGSDIATYLTNTKQGTFGISCTSLFGQTETHCTADPNLTCIKRIP